MDHDPLIDDLFGDGESVQLQTTPIIKGLPKRIDELSGSSCCQRISWSKEGSIAAVASDLKSVDLYILNRSPRSGKWRLGKSSTIIPDLADAKIAHIAWSHLGSDLSLIDTAGRVHIYKTAATLGRARLLRQGANDSVNDFDAIVGLHWLNVTPHNKMTGTCWSATRSGSHWGYELKNHLQQLGASNPVYGSNSFFAVTRSGQIRLYFAAVDGQYSERSVPLDGLPSIGNLITHASFAPHIDGSMLLATYDSSRRLKLYKIAIGWQYQEQDPQTKDQQPPNPLIQVDPQLLEEACEPLPNNHADHNGTAIAGLDGPNLTQLTHLELIPFVPERALPAQNLTLLATYVSLPPASTVMFNPAHRYQGATSVVCRWDVKVRSETSILPIMDELGLSRLKKQDGTVIRISDIRPRPELYLERHPDNYLHAIVLSQSAVRHSTLVSFYLSDGSIQFRFRDSMELASADGNYEEVRSFPQAGFAFPQHEPALNIVLSPSYCCAVTTNSAGDVQLRKMEYSVDNLNSLKEDQPQFGALSALFAACTVSGYLSYTSTDDIIAIVPPDINQALSNAISEQLMMACTSMGGHLDFSTPDANQLMAWLSKTQMSLRCLSFHYVLTPISKEELKPNALLIWALFNMRMITSNILGCMKPENRWRPEVAHSLVPNNKYAWSIVAYMVQAIADMAHHLKGKFKDQAAIQEYIRKERTPALHMLLCSLSRKVIRAMLNLIGKELSLTQARSSTMQNDPTQFRQWQNFMSTFKLCPIYHLAIMEKSPLDALISHIDLMVAAIYAKTPGFADSKEERQRSEVRLIVRAEVPTHLMPVVTAILQGIEDLGKQEKYDRGVLYRFDTSWIGIGYDDSCSRRKTYDVVRKTEVGPNARVKRCPRCSSVTEESESARMPVWAAQNVKYCICGAQWTTWGEKDKKSKKSEKREKSEKTEKVKSEIKIEPVT